MTVAELRNHPEYEVCMKKIRSYKKGFEFTMNWTHIPERKANGLKVIMKDAIEMGLIEQIATGLNLELEVTDETYRRI